MTNEMFKKEAFKKSVKDNVKFLYRKTIEEATQEQIFQAVSYTVKDVIIDNWLATQKSYDEQDPKIVYYMSMEFLMGRALGNNLINLCAYGEVKEALEELGFDLNCIEDQEPDPALGNGGLGRLAACFLDSLATLNYAAYGCGIRYHYGMFKQKIENGYQIEVPDNWLKNGYPFELRRPEYAKEVHFGGYVRVEYDPEKGGNKFIHEGYQAVKAIPYDMPIVGFDNNMVNTLMIWDAEPKEVFSLESFDKGEYDKAVEEYDTILQQTSADKKNVGKMKEIAQALADFSDSNYAGALPVLEQYVKDYPELYLYIGTCYASMNDAEHMFENYEKYIDKYGYNSYLYAQYAAYYISIGEMDNAYGYINNGLASDNTFQKELRLQEISYYEKIQNYDKAYELAKELYELYPEYQDGVDEYNFLYTRVSHDDE